MTSRILENWPQKLGALLLAALIWFFVSTSETTITQRSLLVPLAIEGVGDRRVAVGLPDVVEVTISGPSTRVDRLRPENIEAVLDLGGLQGEFQQTIDVRPPQGIELIRVNPEQVIGFLETVTSKEVPVNVVRLGSPPADTQLRSSTEPSMVTVTARTEILQRVTLALAPIPAAAGEVDIAVFAADSEGFPVREVTIEPATIAVTTVARPLFVQRSLPVTLEPPDADRIGSVDLATTSATVIGPPSTLATIENLVARVDLETVPTATGRYNLPVRLELPAGVMTVEAPMASVTVVDPALSE